MSTGEFQTLGLSIHLFRPSIVLDDSGEPHHCAITPRGRLLADVTNLVSSYAHTHSAFGGFDTASFSITATQEEVETWYDQALGAHVETVDEAGDIVWEGYIDQVDIQLGPLAITRGPVTDIANQVYVVYQEKDTSTSPNTHSAPRILKPILETPESQRVYGIRAAFLTLSAATASVAQQIGTMWMYENAWPRLSEQVSLSSSGGGGPTINFSCRGYFHSLTQTYYTAALGNENASVKLGKILDWEGTYVNGLFSSANAFITANTTQVPVAETDYIEMKTQIEEIVSVGDATFQRYLFQVGPERLVTYGPMPTTYLYQQDMTWERQQIRLRTGEIVMPWAVKSGQWLRLLNWLPGAEEAATYREDSRYMFIEQVTYTAPFDVALAGGKTDRIDQVMAQLGLAGETATT